MNRAPRDVPVLIAFAESSLEPSWGRFDALSAVGARVLTRAEVRRRDELFLSFQVGGDSYQEIPAETLYVETDSDGYRLLDLKFRDEVAKRRLAKTLLDILA